jgi:hypothetical protein
MRLALTLSIGCMALAGSCAAQGSLVGHWTGKIRPDVKILMKQSNAPEFKKLMAYTINRLEKSNLGLTLEANGEFEWLFDDGYLPDRGDIRGHWRQAKNMLLLDVPGHPPHTEKMALTDSNRKFTTSFQDIPGLSCLFTHDK